MQTLAKYRLSLAALIFLCAGSSAFIVAQRLRLSDLEHALAAARGARDRLEAELVASRNERTELEQRTLSVRPSLPPPVESIAATPAADAGGRRFAGGPGGRGGGRIFAELIDNPDVQRGMLTQLRSNLDQRYAELFRRLQLSPAALARFKDLLAERQAATMDARLSGRMNGLDDPAQIQALVSDAQAAIDSDINTLLGQEAFATFQDFETHSAQYSLVQQLEQRLCYSATPLAADQSAELVRLLAQLPDTAPAGDAMFGGPRMGSPGGPLGGNSQVTITDEAIVAASALLTTEQVAALQELQSEQQTARQMMDFFGPAMGGRGRPAGGRAGGGAPP